MYCNYNMLVYFVKTWPCNSFLCHIIEELLSTEATFHFKISILQLYTIQSIDQWYMMQQLVHYHVSVQALDKGTFASLENML